MYYICSCMYLHRSFVDKKWHVLAYVCFFPGNIGKEKGMMCYLKEENIVIYYTERKDCLLGSHGRHEMTKSGSAIKKCHNIVSLEKKDECFVFAFQLLILLLWTQNLEE